MLYLVNSFSLNMVSLPMGEIQFSETDKKMVKRLLAKGGYTIAIGHETTANVIQKELELPMSPFNRRDVTIYLGDELIVAQYKGPRLPEGATELPEGAKITYYHVILTQDK